MTQMTAKKIAKGSVALLKALQASDPVAVKKSAQVLTKLLTSPEGRAVLQGNEKVVTVERLRVFPRRDGSKGCSFYVKENPEDRYGLEHVAYDPTVVAHLERLAQAANGHPFDVKVDGTMDSVMAKGVNGTFRKPQFVILDVSAQALSATRVAAPAKPAPAQGSAAPANPSADASEKTSAKPTKTGFGFSRFMGQSDEPPEDMPVEPGDAMDDLEDQAPVPAARAPAMVP